MFYYRGKEVDTFSVTTGGVECSMESERSTT